jgi:DNA-binding MarR family transcriptional regulator
LPKGLLASHFSVLNHPIRVSDGRTPLELATAFQVPKTTLSHTLGLLEKRGWIEMRPNPGDGRSKRVWITDAGRACRDEAIAALAPDIAAAIDLSEVEALLPRLQVLRRHMDEARNPPKWPRRQALCAPSASPATKDRTSSTGLPAATMAEPTTQPSATPQSFSPLPACGCRSPRSPADRSAP